jgi:LacI family sucrose operon transcriptional repressor
VAEKAGVSVTTVSRVLNNRGSLSEKTRSKVHAAMGELNYYPNQIAVNLFRQRTMLVGLIMPDVSHAFYSLEIKYIEEALHAAGYKLMLCNAGESKEREKEYLIMLQRNKVDGIIIASHTLYLDDYSRIRSPVVALDRYLGKNIPTISADHVQGGSLAAKELIRNGCKKVAQIKGYSAVLTPSNKRHEVFREIMEENHIECLDYEETLNSFRFSEYIDFVHDIFTNEPGIDGLFAADNLALAALKIAYSLDISVPRHLKIVGYDGTELSLMSSLSLSTIVQPIKKITQATVDTLLSMILEKTIIDPGTHLRFPVTFIRRDTTL